MSKNVFYTLGSIAAVAVLIAALIVSAAGLSDTQRPANAQAQNQESMSVQNATCYDTSKLVDELNTAHAADANNVEPVLTALNAVPEKEEVNVGESIPNSPNDGFSVYWTEADVDESRVEKEDANGVVVALMGGSKGTVFAVYDTAVTVPASGFYLDNLCERINPSAMLDYWPGFNPVPPTVVAPTTVAPTADDCVDPDKLVKRLNAQHTVNENDPSVVIAWLESLGVGTAFEVGESLKAAQDSSVLWTESDIDERFFQRTSSGGVIVAYFGGSQTILGIYDGEWTSPVAGMMARMCDRLNPEHQLDYWAIKD